MNPSELIAAFGPRNWALVPERHNATTVTKFGSTSYEHHENIQQSDQVDYVTPHLLIKLRGNTK
jgi:hypothetical protein